MISSQSSIGMGGRMIDSSRWTLDMVVATIVSLSLEVHMVVGNGSDLSRML
jgi:hypothetical protein